MLLAWFVFIISSFPRSTFLIFPLEISNRGSALLIVALTQILQPVLPSS